DSMDQLDAANAYLAAPVEGGEVTGLVSDLQAKFNLNNLSRTLNASGFQRELERFNRLLGVLQLDNTLGNAVVDWLDADVETSIPNGAEDDYYYAQQPPYRAANTLMSSPSELRLIRGFHESEIFDKILPFVATLPVVTAININTAPAEVLKSLTTDITDDDVNQIIQQRGGENASEGQAFESADDFKNYMQGTLKKENFPMDGIATASDYFMMQTNAHVGQGQVRLNSVIQRDQQGNARIINRALGNW
ncbi:MAG: general secretion pathway protein GspK, partial [Gammaproteobacteria bacterium]